MAHAKRKPRPQAMNRIVHQHYPAAKLPGDLRDGLDPQSEVTVIVETEEEPPERVMSLDEIFAARRPPFRTAKEIDAEIRQSRDEWDD